MEKQEANKAPEERREREEETQNEQKEAVIDELINDKLQLRTLISITKKEFDLRKDLRIVICTST